MRTYKVTIWEEPDLTKTTHEVEAGICHYSQWPEKIALEINRKVELSLNPDMDKDDYYDTWKVEKATGSVKGGLAILLDDRVKSYILWEEKK